METLPIIIAVVGVIATVIAYVVGSHASDTKVLALNEKLDAMGSKPVKTSPKKKSSPKTQTATPKAKDNKKLNELKETVKKTKNQLHSAKAEIKTLKENAKSTKKSTTNNSAKKDADLIFNLREEVGELKSALENAKTQVSQKKKEKPVQVERVVETEGMDDSAKAIVNELETAHRTKIKSLNDKHKKTEKETRQKMRAASSNVDKQRRRADNNDRAYKITQRQVDALQERISFLEKGPNDKPVELQVASVAVTATPEVRVTSELKAKPAPVKTQEPLSESDEVPVGLTAPSEPTTIEMSPDIAESLFNSSDEDTAKIAVSVDSLVASPSSVEEEPSRQTMRLDDVRLTNELESPAKNKLSEASAVDDAWAEFDVD